MAAQMLVTPGKKQQRALCMTAEWFPRATTSKGAKEAAAIWLLDGIESQEQRSVLGGYVNCRCSHSTLVDPS